MKDSVKVERLGLADVSAGVLERLERLYLESFHNSHMYERLLEDLEREPPVFQLFLARLLERPEEVVGARVIESHPHPSIDYRGFTPIHGKRFSVLPELRGRGVGKELVAEGKSYCFDDLKVSVIFGESNEMGALSMHGREGALYLIDSIERMSIRSRPEENVAFFKEFLTNPKFRAYRIPTGEGIQFIYCRDAKTSASFEDCGYVSRANLLLEP